MPAIWLDVPFVKQDPEGCGAASIAMVMQYWLTQDGQTTGRARRCGVHSAFTAFARGSWHLCFRDVAILRGARIHTFSFTGDWEMLQQHLQKGRPLIVALKPSAMNHCAALCGCGGHRFAERDHPGERSSRTQIAQDGPRNIRETVGRSPALERYCSTGTVWPLIRCFALLLVLAEYPEREGHRRGNSGESAEFAGTATVCRRALAGGRAGCRGHIPAHGGSGL